MSSRPQPPALRQSLAAYLEQRLRLGEPEFFPEGMSAEKLLSLAGSRPGKEPLAESTARAASGRVSGRTAADPTSSLPVAALETGTYDELRAAALVCERCRLSTSRTQVVFSDGNPSARLMVIGEAPGANEDATGLPFVGQAGKLLDLMLASVGLSREDTVYICNVLKCRPPGNRNPLPEEIESCSPLLKRQIELVSPEVILGVGSFAAQWLTGTQKALGKLRGTTYSYQGVPLVVTYHPAALLRNPGWSRPTWEDFQLLRQVMAGQQSR